MEAVVRRRWGSARDVVEQVTLPDPEPANDEVLVRVRASSINRGDYYALGGTSVIMRPLLGGFRRPKNERFGGDFAGTAVRVGTAVGDIAPGDDVYGVRSGAFAELVTVKTAIARKPANLDFEQAAAVPVAALTALQAIRDKGKLEARQRVLVIGASGGVGTFAVQIAKALGAAHVTAVCSTRNVERARELGADRVVDYTREDYLRLGEQFDLIVHVAGSNPWRKDRRLLTPTGRMIMAGASGNVLAYIGRVWLASRIGKRTAVFFVCKPNRADLATLTGLIEQGQVRPVVDRVYPLAEVADALAAMGDGHTRGKLVVRIS